MQEWFDSIKTVDDVTCSREEFVTAAEILNNPKESVSEAIGRLDVSGGTSEKVIKILDIARWIASKNGIEGGTPDTSDRILCHMDQSKNMQIRGIGGYVRQIMDGEINVKLERMLAQIIDTVQPLVPYGKRLSPLNVQLMAKISLQECYVDELVKFFHKKNPAMTDLLDRLENSKYIKRYHKKTEDRRKVFLKLTKKGRYFLTLIHQELNKYSATSEQVSLSARLPPPPFLLRRI